MNERKTQESLVFAALNHHPLYMNNKKHKKLPADYHGLRACQLLPTKMEFLERISQGSQWKGFQTSIGEPLAHIYFRGEQAYILTHKIAMTVRVCQLRIPSHKFAPPIFCHVNDKVQGPGYAVIIPRINTLPNEVLEDLSHFYKRSFMYSGVGEELTIHRILFNHSDEFAPEVKEAMKKSHDFSGKYHKKNKRSLEKKLRKSDLSELRTVSSIPPSEKWFTTPTEIVDMSILKNLTKLQQNLSRNRNTIIPNTIEDILIKNLANNNINYINAKDIVDEEKIFLCQEGQALLKKIERSFEIALFINTSTKIHDKLFEYCQIIASNKLKNISLHLEGTYFFAKKHLDRNQLKALHNSLLLEQLNVVIKEKESEYFVLIPLNPEEPKSLIVIDYFFSLENLLRMVVGDIDTPQLIYDINNYSSVKETKERTCFEPLSFPFSLGKKGFFGFPQTRDEKSTSTKHDMKAEAAQKNRGEKHTLSI